MLILYPQVSALVTLEAAVLAAAAVEPDGARVAVIVHLEAPSEVNCSSRESCNGGSVLQVVVVVVYVLLLCISKQCFIFIIHYPGYHSIYNLSDRTTDVV